jgi:hypothetical protein
MRMALLVLLVFAAAVTAVADFEFVEETGPILPPDLELVEETESTPEPPPDTDIEFFQATGPISQSPLEIVKDWRILAILALGFSIVLVAIAYMIGIGLEMPEMRAWAGTELSQIFANALIILLVIVVIAFVDVMAIAIAVDADLDLPECLGIGTQTYDTCLQSVANEYLQDYVDTAKLQMRNILVENVKAVNYMNQRAGLYCTSILCLQVGVTTTFAANYLLDSDMYTLLFEYYGNLLGFMEAQLFFVNEVSFKIGPILLAVGIVARAFYFTRKIGGLLIAVALGITFFFPGMYIFDWATLDMVMTSDKGVDSQKSDCPAECTKQTPIAYYYNDSGLQMIYDPMDFKGLFTEGTMGNAGQLYEGKIASASGTNGSALNKIIHSCIYFQESDFPYTMGACPLTCRSLPYPTATQCLEATIKVGNANVTYNVQKACSVVPTECKVVKEVRGIEGTAEYESCPSACKVVPPLKSDCRYKDAAETEEGNCLDSSVDCRIAKVSDLSWRPSIHDSSLPKAKACNKAKDCVASLTANDSCVYVFPDTGPCEDLCVGCDEECRLIGADFDNLPSNLKDHCNSIQTACDACHDTCKVKLSDISALSPPAGQCTDCPEEMRLMAPDIPEEYTQDSCSFQNCPAEYRIFMPRSACQMCLFTEAAYAYRPPINNKCDELCKPSDNVPTKDAEDYAKIGEDGLVGKANIQSLSKLMLPIYVLPLFNIVATLVFIKGLSRILGGDIEIPGISKVF